MKWYLIVTADKYELPIAMFARAKQAAEWLGYRDDTAIFRAINLHRTTHKGFKVERVEI